MHSESSLFLDLAVNSPSASSSFHHLLLHHYCKLSAFLSIFTSTSTVSVHIWTLSFSFSKDNCLLRFHIICILYVSVLILNFLCNFLLLWMISDLFTSLDTTYILITTALWSFLSPYLLMNLYIYYTTTPHHLWFLKNSLDNFVFHLQAFGFKDKRMNLFPLLLLSVLYQRSRNPENLQIAFSIGECCDSSFILKLCQCESTSFSLA